MTTTDTDASSTALEEAITSTDPVTLAKVWGMGGMTAVLVGLVAGLLVSLERLDLDGAGVFGSADEVFQFWSVHRVALLTVRRTGETFVRPFPDPVSWVSVGAPADVEGRQAS